MPCVGNDVVDLKDPANAGKSRDSRFLRKILTDAEIESVNKAVNPDMALWSLWACKEAAYKVTKKIFPETAFMPRRWQAVFKKSKTEYPEGEVIIPETAKIFVRLFSSPQYVHCIGVDKPDIFDHIIWRVETLPQAQDIGPTEYLRCCLAQNLAQYFSLDFHQIKIKREKEKGELKPPCVYVKGKKTDIDVSLSHDGRFVAYVFCYPGF